MAQDFIDRAIPATTLDNTEAGKLATLIQTSPVYDVERLSEIFGEVGQGQGAKAVYRDIGQMFEDAEEASSKGSSDWSLAKTLDAIVSGLLNSQGGS